MRKKYYKIVFHLDSSLSIGSGKNERTDSDIIRNSLGAAYIPGTALAGVYRSLFSEDFAKTYFGDVKIATGEDDSTYQVESAILVYDANLLDPGKSKVSNRDCVALDKYKTAVPGAKFDFEILEPGCRFVTYLEQNQKSDSDPDIGELIFNHWQSIPLSFGKKTTRGLGRTILDSVQRKTFALDDSEQVVSWLSFDMYSAGDEDWETYQCVPCSQDKDWMSILLRLKQIGGISIRQYTTDVSENDKAAPDYTQLTVKEDVPVIPGTSWSGAFRHHMLGLNSACADKMFGKTEGAAEKDFDKSRIYFSESELSGGVYKQITRNALNRFTNATIDGALYTEKYYANGTTSLEIRLKKSDAKPDFCRLLAASIADIDLGLLCVGGLTAVGRGVFSINGIDFNGDSIYQKDMNGTAEKIFSVLCDRMLAQEVK